MNDPVLAQALAALDTVDVAASGDAGCTDLLRAIRKVRGWVDAVEARVTSRVRELHATELVPQDPLGQSRLPRRRHARSAYDRRP